MVVKAFAKINLGLSVLGKRKDGYHDIATIFAEVGVFDELRLRLLKNSDIKLQCVSSNTKADSHFGAPNDQTNLAYRAARLLQERYQVQYGVSIRLTKKIPIGAGLGGGSSDAAATLRALNTLWKLKLPTNTLEKLGAELGSDVSFFIRGGVQAGSGRGEILQQKKLPAHFPRYVVLVSPGIHISTAWAYREMQNAKCKMQNSNGDRPDGPEFCLRVSTPGVPQITAEIMSARTNIEFQPLGSSDALVNDFESVVFAKYPELATIKQQLLARGAQVALLSGSGSTVFGLFDDEPEKNLKYTFPDCTVAFTRIATRR